MKKVLLLNADFQPFKLISWKQAMIQILVQDKSGCYPVEYYENWEISDGRGNKYQVPAVIALKEYVNTGNDPAPYTKGNIFARDGMTCQYCGQVFLREELTVDHVIPRCRWSILGNGERVSSYKNIVTACKSCNSRKADRTCAEAEMYPIHEPKAITRREVFVRRLKMVEKIPPEWEPYIKGIR